MPKCNQTKFYPKRERDQQEKRKAELRRQQLQKREADIVAQIKAINEQISVPKKPEPKKPDPPPQSQPYLSGGTQFPFLRFWTISPRMMRILTQHIQIKDSSESKLSFMSICSVRILSP